jgi:hypothetical protein
MLTTEYRCPLYEGPPHKKAAPFLGPLFKEAERREVREDFARYRSDKQNGHVVVVENFGLW